MSCGATSTFTGIQTLKLSAGCFDNKGGTIELRRGSPTGAVLASVVVNPTGDDEFLELPATLSKTDGLTDLCVLARYADKATVLGINWIEFQS